MSIEQEALPAGAVPASAESPDVAEPEPLSSNRDFKVVLFGQGISSFGDAITNTALPLLVLALTGSGAVMGLVGALSTLPDLVFGLFAGAYADRRDRRLMMMFADAGRAILTAAVPVSILLGGPTMLVILVVTFPINLLRVTWLAAWTASVPGLVGRPQIARANAIFEAVFNIGWIAGPGLAGVLSFLIGPGTTIALDAVSFAISALALLLVRRPLKPEPRPNQPHILADIREGIRYVSRHPTLRAVIAFWAASQVATAALGTALTYHLTRERGESTAVLGLVLSAFSVGALGGSLVAGRLGLERVGRVMLVATALTGGLLLTIVAAPPIPVVFVVSLAAGVVQSAALISYVTFRTALSPDALLGRIGSTARTISVGLMPIGAFVGGALVDVTSGQATLALMGGTLLGLSGGFALLPSVRRARVPRGGGIE
jgi:MFS transporter, ENTS family, enterobactin (siderophore) exporter